MLVNNFRMEIEVGNGGREVIKGDGMPRSQLKFFEMGWQVIKCVGEGDAIIKTKRGECGRKVVHRILEVCAEAHSSERRRREAIHWLTEIPSKSNTCERGREVIHWLIEVITKGEVGERGRKIVYWLIERRAENGSPEGEGEMINRTIEPRSEVDCCQ